MWRELLLIGTTWNSMAKIRTESFHSSCTVPFLSPLGYTAACELVKEIMWHTRIYQMALSIFTKANGELQESVSSGVSVSVSRSRHIGNRLWIWGCWRRTPAWQFSNRSVNLFHTVLRIIWAECRRDRVYFPPVVTDGLCRLTSFRFLETSPDPT